MSFVGRGPRKPLELMSLFSLDKENHYDLQITNNFESRIIKTMTMVVICASWSKKSIIIHDFVESWIRKTIAIAITIWS